MPRILLIFVFILVRIGRGLVILKNELVTGVLYFIVLAPSAFVGRLRPNRDWKFHDQKSSWVDISTKESL